MIANIICALGGLSVGAVIGSVLMSGLARTKGFEQGMSDGQSQGLRGMPDGDRVHAEGLTDAAR